MIGPVPAGAPEAARTQAPSPGLSFRAKTVLGIAAIEVLLLALLISLSLDYLANTKAEATAEQTEMPRTEHDRDKRCAGFGQPRTRPIIHAKAAKDRVEQAQSVIKDKGPQNPRRGHRQDHGRKEHPPHDPESCPVGIEKDRHHQSKADFKDQRAEDVKRDMDIGRAMHRVGESAAKVVKPDPFGVRIATP